MRTGGQWPAGASFGGCLLPVLPPAALKWPRQDEGDSHPSGALGLLAERGHGGTSNTEPAVRAPLSQAGSSEGLGAGRGRAGAWGEGGPWGAGLGAKPERPLQWSLQRSLVPWGPLRLLSHVPSEGIPVPPKFGVLSESLGVTQPHLPQRGLGLAAALTPLPSGLWRQLPAGRTQKEGPQPLSSQRPADLQAALRRRGPGRRGTWGRPSVCAQTLRPASPQHLATHCSLFGRSRWF